MNTVVAKTEDKLYTHKEVKEVLNLFCTLWVILPHSTIWVNRLLHLSSVGRTLPSQWLRNGLLCCRLFSLIFLESVSSQLCLWSWQLVTCYCLMTVNWLQLHGPAHGGWSQSSDPTLPASIRMGKNSLCSPFSPHQASVHSPKMGEGQRKGYVCVVSFSLPYSSVLPCEAQTQSRPLYFSVLYCSLCNYFVLCISIFVSARYSTIVNWEIGAGREAKLETMGLRCSGASELIKAPVFLYDVCNPHKTKRTSPVSFWSRLACHNWGTPGNGGASANKWGWNRFHSFLNLIDCCSVVA